MIHVAAMLKMHLLFIQPTQRDRIKGAHTLGLSRLKTLKQLFLTSVYDLIRAQVHYPLCCRMDERCALTLYMTCIIIHMIITPNSRIQSDSPLKFMNFMKRCHTPRAHGVVQLGNEHLLIVLHITSCIIEAMKIFTL